MPITWIGATDHFPEGVGVLRQNTPWGVTEFASTYRQPYLTKSGSGMALRPVAGTQPVRGEVTIPLRNLAPGYPLLPDAGGHTVTKITIGMRVKVRGAVGYVANDNYLFALTDYPSDAGYQNRLPIGPILSWLFNGGPGAAQMDGYWEVVIQVPLIAAQSSAELYKDGVLVGGVAIPAMATFRQTNVQAVWYLGNSKDITFQGSFEGWYCDMTDMYCTMDLGIPGDEFTGRLGPINLVRLPVKTVDAPGYVASNTALTPAETLNLSKVANDAKNPNLTSPANNAPLKVTFDTSGIGAKKVLGVKIDSAVFKDPGVVVGVTTSLVDGETTIAGADIAPDGTVSPYTPKESPIATITKMPSGDALTATSLANLEVVLTPA